MSKAAGQTNLFIADSLTTYQLVLAKNTLNTDRLSVEVWFSCKLLLQDEISLLVDHIISNGEIIMS